MFTQFTRIKVSGMAKEIRRKLLKGRPPPPGYGLVGHPTKLSQEMQDDFIDFVLRGLPPPRACDLVGISERTYYLWMQKGKRYADDIENGEQNDKHRAFYEFYRQVNRAISMWMIRFVDRLSLHTVDSTWYRDLAVLERRDPSNWGKQADHLYRGRDEFDPQEEFL